MGKEQVVGLLIALRLFTGGSYEKQNIRNLKLLENLYRKLNPKFQSLAEIVMTPGSEEPVLHLRTGKKDPDSAFALILSLEQEEPSLLVFGTGWGLEKNLIQNADHALLPIEGINGFNHLPVRGAIAIILDRLLGLREPSVD